MTDEWAATAGGELSEPQLRDIFENAPMAMHFVGPDGRILWANRSELQLLGYGGDEYVGRPIAEFHVEPAEAEAMLARLARNEELHGHEARLRAKDGSIKHVLVTSNVCWQDETFLHTRCFTQDVSAHKRAEEVRLARSVRTERLNQVTAALAEAVTPDQVFEALVDQVCSALSASSAALFLVRHEQSTVWLARAVGYSDAARASLASVPLIGDRTFPALDAIRTGEPAWIGSPLELIERYPHLDRFVTAGRAYSIACLPIVVRGRTLGSVAFTFDDARILDAEQRAFLTLVARYSGQALERLRLLDEEQESRARAELLYQLVGAVISAETIAEVFEPALDAIQRALGTGRASILVFDAQGVMRFRAWRNLSEGYRRAVDGHSPWARDARGPEPILCGDTETDPAMEAYRPVFRQEGIRALAFIPLVSAGNLLGKFMVYYPEPRVLARHEIDLARAIANHVAAAIARFELVEKLQETVRLNELFMGILGHDLRNPLTAILGSAGQALSQEESAKLAKPLSRILRSGNRMSRMIDQLLDFTRLRLHGGLPLQRKDVDILPAIRQVVDELDNANQEWSIHLDMTGHGRGHWDADRLCQVFSNLLGNAIQHGEVEGGVGMRVDGLADDRLRVEIHNGGAISEAKLSRLFEPLASADDSRGHSQGLGLGLFITHEIVGAHGGEIRVASDPSRGTTFIVELPRHSG